jgi:dihydroorotase
MNLLIRQARVISGESTHKNKTVDLFIENGIIREIGKSISKKQGVKEIGAQSLCVSEGWIDMQAVACDPGFEHREDIHTLADGAAAGGFTTVCIHNFNNPPVHNKGQIEYILNKAKNKLVNVLPFGTITVDGKGKDLAEMYDMKLSGAVGFSDYKTTAADSGMLMRALQYSADAQSFISVHCCEESMSRGGQMNEGEVSTTLGLKGIPAIAEELAVQRYLSILEYAGGHLHIATVSTKGSVEMIKAAKTSGLNVTCGVAAINLLNDDSVLREFDTNYKCSPPLRNKKDVSALRNAVINGTIDVIVSDHLPVDPEGKQLEFDLAEFGILGIQTAFAAACQALGEKGHEALIRCFTAGPRKVLKLEQPAIKEGARAELTLFSFTGTTVLTEKTNQSLSSNSPFFNLPLQGKVIGVINGNKSHFNTF